MLLFRLFEFRISIFDIVLAFIQHRFDVIQQLALIRDEYSQIGHQLHTIINILQ